MLKICKHLFPYLTLPSALKGALKCFWTTLVQIPPLKQDFEVYLFFPCIFPHPFAMKECGNTLWLYQIKSSLPNMMLLIKLQNVVMFGILNV